MSQSEKLKEAVLTTANGLIDFVAGKGGLVRPVAVPALLFAAARLAVEAGMKVEACEDALRYAFQVSRDDLKADVEAKKGDGK